MVTSALLILCVACLYVQGLPNPPVTRNTIFLDEKLEGQIFEDIDAFSELSTDDIQKYRLPTTTRPIEYKVLWKIDIINQTFSGSVAIALEATRPNVTEIIIHAHDMTISTVVLQRGDIIIPQTYTLEPALHFLKVNLSNNYVLQYDNGNAIKYILKIDFNSNLRDDMSGIYKSWFRNNPNEDRRWIASTQFQATAARFAFPCYDEPSFKAKFQVTIRRPTTHKSWFCTTSIHKNLDVVGEPNYKDDVYAITPIMSTYLLALIVAEYESITDNNETDKFDYEVIARPGAFTPVNQGNYSLVTGKKLTEVMNELTGINYFEMENIIKMTHAAIPDFSAGAMENWGLITYREAYLMYDEAHSNDHYKQIIAYILSHEIAHMWFGNLVTCDFWDNTWLNEGFARYYQYFLTDEAEKTMGFPTRFINEQVHAALLVDSSETAHPLTNPVGSPDSVSDMFSTITYNKGAAVIRMTEHLLGKETHTAGLRGYLKDRSYKTAKPIHLFQALQDAAVADGAISQYGNFSVIDYYKSWTEQNGHPLLFVEVNHQTGEMRITQRRFSINTGYATKNLNYIVPITFYTASNPDFNDLKPSDILTESVSVINRGSVGDEWVIFNKQQTGFYRVTYDDYTWNLIIIALRDNQTRTAIHEYNRAQIVNDVFQFARAGIMSYNRALNILSFLKEETAYTPWVTAVTGFNWLQNRLVGTKYQPLLEKLIVDWAAKVMGELTYSPIAGESFMRSFLRYQIAPLMCRLNERDCRDSARTQLRALVANPAAEVPVNSRHWVYCNGLREGTGEDFNFLWNRYLNHNVYTEKILILQNIGCTTDPESLNAFLTNIIKNETEIRPQDYNSAFNSALTGNEENTEIVLQFIQNNTVEVLQALKTSALTNTLARLRSDTDIDAFDKWAKETLEAEVYASITNSIKSAREGRQWYTTIEDDLNKYFENKDEDITTTSSTTAPVTSASTVTAPALQEPSTPKIPDSAITSTLSVVALTVAVIVNIVV
nr:membrane alanyl aminopeptidase-like isoform X1 [Maniola hyperantus]